MRRRPSGSGCGRRRSLAAKCISDAARRTEREVRHAAERARGRRLVDVVDAMLDRQLRSILDSAATWSALFLLERQLSTPTAFRAHYEAWVAMWAEALGSASDPPRAERRAQIARMAHSISYGWLSQCLLTLDTPLDERGLREELGRALQGYLEHAAQGRP